MSRHRRNIRRALTLLLAIALVPTAARADEGSGWFEGLVTACREIDESGGVGAYLSKKLSNNVDSGLKSVLSLLPGNADDVVEVAQHTNSLMDRSFRQIEHMVDTQSTDGDERFWSETQNEANQMLYDALAPDVLKKGIKKGQELVENANWLAEKAEGALAALDNYFSGGGDDTPGNGGSGLDHWDQVLRNVGETPAPTENELTDLSGAADLTMTSRDTYSGYEAVPASSGTSFADSFQAASTESFEHARAESESLIESSVPEPMDVSPRPSSADAGELTGPKQPTMHADPTRQPQRADCDPDAVMAKLTAFIKSIDLDPPNEDACSADRNQINVSTRELAVFEGCSLDGPLGAMAKPIQGVLENAQASLKACLKQEENRRREEEERRREECVRCLQYRLCPDYCGK